MASMEDKYLKEILENLNPDVVTVLVGEAGVGKTRLAKEVFESAVKKGVASRTLWLTLNKNYNKESMIIKISQQLSLISKTNEMEDYSTTEKDSEEEKLEVIKNTWKKKIDDMILQMSSDQYILLVLDDVRGPKNEEDIIQDIYVLQPLKENKKLKVLSTRREDNTRSDNQGTKKVIKISPLNLDVVVTVLVGEAGVGKTRLAKEICKSAAKKGVASRTLWLSLNKNYNKTSMIIEISQQLSLISKTDEMEDYSTTEKDSEEENLEVIKNTWKKKIDDMILKMSPDQYILLVLDDVRGPKNEEDIIQDIYVLQPLKENKKLKVLSTRREDNTSGDIQGTKEVIKISPLSVNEAEGLLNYTVTEEVSKLRFFDGICTNVVAKSNCIPATVSAIANILNYVADKDGSSLPAAFKELARCKETYSNGTRQLMRYAYELLPKNEMILVNCCWHCRKFFSKNSGLHYSELIVNWILEGCFGPVDSLEKAYEEGHRVLMKLIDLKMLKIEEANVVAMEGSALSIPDARDSRLGLALDLGLHGVYEDEEWKGFGRTAAADCMIKSISRDEKNRWKKVSTVLIDGIHLGRQVYETFFNPMEDIQHLILMNPKFDSLPLSISKMKNLRLLVLRGCDRLTSIDGTIELPFLTVLEISGARNFSEIPESVFKFSKIQSLNFSDTGIVKISDSLSNMMKLRSLVLRGCSSLESLPKLSKLVHLIVIDLSGASSLIKMEDKSFSSLESLQILDLSQTQIEKMPILKGLKSLTRVSLNDCKRLKRLRRLTSLPDLQVLELYGCSDLIEFHDDAFESKNSLKILDLSRANVPCLPSSFKSFLDLEFLNLSGMPEMTDLGPDTFKHMSNLQFLDLSNSQIKELPSVSDLPNLRQFILRDCKKIESLPPLTSLQKLEVFDVSGCCLLADIGEDSFNKMAFLLRLNLSETKIQKLPYIVGNCNPRLQQLLMRNCTQLVEFPSKFSLSKLEELDLSGTKCLKENEDHFCVDIDMRKLQILNLSGTNFKLQSLSNLINLKKLLLRDVVLDAQLDFENLTQLEVLDLSRARGIKSLPSSIEKLSHLRKLLLRDCSVTDLTHVKSIKSLEVLDLWGVSINQFPYWVAELEGLKRLDLPDLSTVSSSIKWEKIKRIPGELNLSRCASLDFSGTKSINDRPSILVNDKFFENFKLWGNCVSQFHIVVRSQKDQLDDEDIDSLRDEGRFRDIYFSTISFENLEAPLMKVIGFDSFPSGVKEAVNQAEYVSLIQNRFLESLSELGSLNKMKGCWLQGCSTMASILREERTDGEEEKGKMKITLENLEILWISSLPKLSAFDGRRPAEIFRNLRHLYLDCCPLVETVFSSADLPSNLEILQIKFCDKLKILFECDQTGEEEEPTLPKLYKLNLIELPQLSCIGAKFPSLKTAVVSNCPKLDYSKESDKLKNESIVVYGVEESWDGSEWTELKKTRQDCSDAA